MGLVAGTGNSSNTAPDVAAQEAVKAAREKLGTNEPLLALVYSSIQYDQERLLRAIAKELPATCKVVGCSTAGEITERGADHKSLAIMLLGGQGVSLASTVAGNLDENSQAAGSVVAQEIKKQLGSDPRLLLLMPDGLSGDGTQVLEGIRKELPAGLVVGGSAGDDFFFRKTYQYSGTQVLSGQVAAVGFGGAVVVGVGVGLGWRNLGIPKRITGSKGKIVSRIDGKPALSFYEDYFGKDNVDRLQRESLARLAITYPLGIRLSADEPWLIRYPLTVDEKGALTCGATIPQGAEVDLMIGGKEEIKQSAIEAAQQALLRLGGRKPKAVFVYDSVARDRILAHHAGEEINAVIEVFGQDVPLIGFYSYAEQGPSGWGTGNDLVFHNESIVVVAVGE